MIIDYEQQLRELVPNVFATVKGETPLSAKLAPFVSSAEQWIITTFTSMEVMRQICLLDDGAPIKVTVERAVVCEAMRTVIPSLDIVLTPNGFGVVSNQNIAPASKERVERLIASLTQQRDELLDSLLSEPLRFSQRSNFPLCAASNPNDGKSIWNCARGLSRRRNHWRRNISRRN